jgi:hypothetical protein
MAENAEFLWAVVGEEHQQRRNGGAIRNVKYRLSFLLLRDSVTKQ